MSVTSAQQSVMPPPSSTGIEVHGQPAGAQPEFTLRAVLVGCVVAAFLGAAYPYVVLKLGFGPNISVVAAFLGYMFIGLIGLVIAPRGNRYEYNIVQTAGTSAGQQGFMVIVLAAFDLLSARPGNGLGITLTTSQIFVWLTLAGGLGVLLAVPLRKHYIDEEQLTFADGVAAGETLIVLDQDRATAKRGVTALTLGGILSALHTWFRDAMPLVKNATLAKLAAPESFFFGSWGSKLHVGFNWSLLSVASGMLVGLRVTLSMALGMALGWFILPPFLEQQGWISAQTFRITLSWIMWPAVGLMVSGGLTALVLKWNLIVRTFKDLNVSAGGTDFPIRWVIVGSSVLAVALIIQQKISLGLSVWLSALAILISIPLMVVGTRVLGETNWAPISSMANLVQVIFAFVSPGSAAVNMVTSGMSGTVAANGEQLMQDYKAGKLIGSNNRYLTYMQLISVPIGALAVALVYPLLRAQNGIGPERFGLDPQYVANAGQGLSAPASVRWAGFAEVLSKGISNLPPYALHAFLISLVLGVVLTLLETKFTWIPSPTSVGLGMLIEAQYVMPMVLGGVIQWLWHRRSPKTEAEFNLPLSSGLIVGEAMISSIILPVLRVTHLLN